ncbi:MAG: SUMF1/EgtB/PvdO family nonheme iron enzyme [Thermodesulfobacteriota bacterium]
MKGRCYGWILFLLLAEALPVMAADRALEINMAENARRTALVIGNSAYPNAPLKNPANDARDMAAALKECGFTVTVAIDSDLRKMEEVISDFGRKLREGGAGLFYYAGHGIQMEGANYLIPVDAVIETPADIRYKAVDASWVLGKMGDAANGLNIVILDACRNNPFARGTRAVDQGLAKMDAPTGSIIAYATAPGSVAADGEGENGIFTRHLMHFMRQPRLKVEEVFKNTRMAVMKETDNRQTPWESSSLMGNFYFNPGVADVAAAPQPSDDVVLPPEATDIGNFDKILKKREQARQKWSEWQLDMTAQYKKAEEYDGSKLLTPAEKIAVWNRFLAAYGPDNPYSRKDDTLRQAAMERKGIWQETAATPRPKEDSVSDAPVKTVLTNSLGMKFVYIRPGVFQMGSPGGEAGRGKDETRHQVTLTRGFFLQTTEVTQRQWKKVMDDNPAVFSDCGGDCPVENISWEDTQQFIDKLNQRDGRIYRLPTEAEWEFAFRAGTRKMFYTGNCLSADQANYDGNFPMDGCSGGPNRKSIVVVGSFPPNPWGLYDMAGNVWEWCQDWYGSYPGGPVSDPAGPSSGSQRVMRGGAWNSYADNCRSANRIGYGPGEKYGNFGFRLALNTDR